MVLNTTPKGGVYCSPLPKRTIEGRRIFLFETTRLMRFQSRFYYHWQTR